MASCETPNLCLTLKAFEVQPQMPSQRQSTRKDSTHSLRVASRKEEVTKSRPGILSHCRVYFQLGARYGD